MQKIILLVSFLSPYWCWGQKLHTPTEIYLMMEKSTIQYHQDSLFDQNPITDFPQIEEGWQKDLATGELRSPGSKVGTNKESKKYQSKGNKFFRKGQFAKASVNYKKALAAEKGFAKAYIRKQLSRSYLQSGKNLDAGSTLKPLLRSHQSDFGLHLLLAEIYHQSQQKKQATKHILLAHLLNRNDRAIQKRMIELLEHNHKTFQEWTFNPQYGLSTTGKTVQISYKDAPWQAYGSCRAVWQNEPQYAEQMSRISNEPREAIEEKECLLNALIAFEQQVVNKNRFPEFKHLSQALVNNEINQFILYEITSRKNPMVLCQMNEEELEKILTYVVKYHCSPLSTKPD